MTKKRKSIFKEETLKDIVQYCSTQEDLMKTLKDLQKVLVEKALEGELSHHLGYSKNAISDEENYRNGYSEKKIITDTGEIDINTPRDRNSSFAPQLIKKRQNQFKGFDHTTGQ